MSTVLWANFLVDGVVSSDESDKYALYEHLDQLDELCRGAGVPPLSDWCDDTDVRFNLSDEELPDGVESSDEIMATEGVWVDAAIALDALEKLLAAIRAGKASGPLQDDHDDIVQELDESIAYARDALAANGKFNFSIVM